MSDSSKRRSCAEWLRASNSTEHNASLAPSLLPLTSIPPLLTIFCTSSASVHASVPGTVALHPAAARLPPFPRCSAACCCCCACWARWACGSSGCDASSAAGSAAASTSAAAAAATVAATSSSSACMPLCTVSRSGRCRPCLLSAPGRPCCCRLAAKGGPSDPALLALLAETVLPAICEGLTVPLPSCGSSMDSRASPIGRRAGGGSGNHQIVAPRKASHAAAMAQPIEVMALTGRPATWRLGAGEAGRAG